MTDETKQELISEAMDSGRITLWIVQEIADKIPENEFTPELDNLFQNAVSGIVMVNLYALSLLQDNDDSAEDIDNIKKNATALREEYLEATLKDPRLPRFGKKFFLEFESGEE